MFNANDEIEVIDIEEYANCEKPIPRKTKYYLIKVDRDKIRVQSPLTAGEILIAAGLNPNEYHLQQKFKGGERRPLELDQEVDFTTRGVERFESVPKEACNG